MSALGQFMARERRSRLEFDPRRFLTGRGAGQSRLQPAPGEIIWIQGEPGEELFFVEKGWIKVSTVSRNGKEALLALPGEGEFIGTRCLIEGYKRIGTATALGDSSLIRITRPALIRLLRQEPDFAQMLLTCVVAQSLRAQRILAEQMTNSSERRLAQTLLRLANGGNSGKQTSQPILARVSQADLATMVGTTRARVSHFMNKFRRQGLIDYNRQGFVTVHKRLAKTVHDL
jgi:CRP/FNR family transcriptional regulator, cyclic AMP receptor protein